MKRQPRHRRHRDALRRPRVRIQYRRARDTPTLAVRDLARDVHVADIHVRVVVQRARAAAGDFDRGAVHVEFVAVAGGGGPCPGLC